MPESVKFKYLGRFIQPDLVTPQLSIVSHHVYDAYEALEDTETEAHRGKNKIKKGNILLVYLNRAEKHIDKAQRHQYVTNAYNMEQMGRSRLAYLEQRIQLHNSFIRSVETSKGGLAHLLIK